MNPSNGHFYLYVRQEKTWHQARDHCASLGGHLATIQTPFENSFVHKLAFSMPSDQNIWLGATDEVQEGTWVWITGEPGGYWNWKEMWNYAAGEGGADDFLFSGDDGTWDDWSADNTAYFVCEWEPTSP